jgi:hypothetical protein
MIALSVDIVGRILRNREARLDEINLLHVRRSLYERRSIFSEAQSKEP